MKSFILMNVNSMVKFIYVIGECTSNDRKINISAFDDYVAKIIGFGITIINLKVDTQITSAILLKR